MGVNLSVFIFFFNDTATTEIYTLSLHDALPIYVQCGCPGGERSDVQCRCPGVERSDVQCGCPGGERGDVQRSEEHTSELQSLRHLVCRLLLEKKNPDPRS